MAKTILLDGTVLDYDSAYHFQAHEFPVSGLDDIERRLQLTAPRSFACVIRGEPIDRTNMVGIRRLKHDHPETGGKATFQEKPHCWLAIDSDSTPLDGADPKDLKLCSGMVLSQLPVEFWNAGCIVQATSQHGLPSMPNIRLRIWFWLSRPLGQEELKVWLADAPVDHSVFNTVQPIYTASPLFEDGRKDHLPTRILRLPGGVVQVPDDLQATPSDGSKRRAEKEPRAERTEKGPREPITAADAERIINSMLAQLANAADGEKHTTLYRVAYTLGGLMAYKGWSESDVAGRLLATLPCAKDWGHARKTALDGVRAGALQPFVVGDFDAKTAQLILSPGSPMRSARELIRRNFIADGLRTLHHQGGVFHRWTGTHYDELSAEEARAATYNFLDSAKRFDKDDKLVPFNPKRTQAGDVVEALRVVAQLPGATRLPAWLGDSNGRPPAAELLACKNGLLHLPTQALLPHSPLFFSPIALDYAYDPNAPEPSEWPKFLASIWPHDAESIATLQELFGLLLTSETKHQKIFLVVGPKRSGKGTIARVLTALLGRANVCNPTLASLGQNFGLSPLIDKPLALIGDARLGGRSTDVYIVAERLLSISGEDGLTIDRKYRDPWTGTLPTRFVVLTNELPKLTDASGALAGRFVVLQMTRSFYGKEDLGLTGRLLEELPGILNWAIAGLDRLNGRGYFVQPASAREAIAELEDLASPVGAFLKAACLVGSDQSVATDVLYDAWMLWCREQHRDFIGTKQSFGRDLRAAIPSLATRQVRRPDGVVREYWGVSLSTPNQFGAQGRDLTLAEMLS